MRKFTACVMVFFTSTFLCVYTLSQENVNSSEKLPINNINANISLADYNINYERKIFELPKSFTNLRIGFGIINSSFDGGYYYNSSLVHLLGKMNSHLELNLGLKYAVQKGFSNSFWPDIYAGYRYEKPSGLLIFRIGVNLYSLYNIGIGIKF
jgi:hypothetical protein